MGQLPLPASADSGSPSVNGRHSASALTLPNPPQSSLKPSLPRHLPDNFALLEVLRQALASGTQSGDSILQATADAARALTSANGVAIALRTKAEILCRARSGELAPELGSPLNVDSGISGECLRSATVLVCTDAETDHRVDPTVCRALGIRSIVVVPLRGQMGMAGVMSAFSARPNAFESAHIDLVRALAEIAEVVYERERRAQDKSSATATPVTKRYLGFVRAQAKAIDTQNATARANAIHFFNARRWILAVSLIALLLISISAVAWWSWHEPAAADNSPANSTAQSTSTYAQASTDRPPLASQPKPNAAVSARHPDRTSSDRFTSDRAVDKDALKKAAELQSLNTPSGNVQTTNVQATNNTTPILTPVSSATIPKVAAPDSEIVDAPPPVTVVAAADSDGIVRLTTEPAKLPALGMAVSQGATEARLIHEVAPPYPQQARAYHIAGSVVLDATIAVDGSLRNVKVVSGQPPLAEAAATAVRQWRYSPELLNGKPVEVQEQITIVFKLPTDETR
jgi:TonB family protein